MPTFWVRGAPVLLCIVLVAWEQARSASDYLIVEGVSRLMVYNKYQQQPAGSDLHVLVPFVPMKILRADDVLGDGFTRCVQVEINGEVFYLLKRKDGTLSTSGPIGFEQTFRNATTLLDTVEILAGESLRFLHPNAPPQSLPAGTRLVRIFRYRNATYCGTVGRPQVHGWVSLSETRKGREWRVIPEGIAVYTVIPQNIVRNIAARLEEANRVLARLFERFNAESRRQLKPPRWTIESSTKEIACVLVGTSTPALFRQSTEYLIKDIENIVLGSRLSVTSAPGRIDIRLP